MTTFEHFTTPRSYTKCVDMELMVDLHGHSYLASFEVSLKLWQDDHDTPSPDCLSEVEAWDGNHQVTDNSTLVQLRAMVVQRLDDEGYESVVEAIEKKEIE